MDAVALHIAKKNGFHLLEKKARFNQHAENFQLQVCATKQQVSC